MSRVSGGCERQGQSGGVSGEVSDAAGRIMCLLTLRLTFDLDVKDVQLLPTCLLSLTSWPPVCSPTRPHILASRLLSHTLVCAACQGADHKGLLVGVTGQHGRPSRPPQSRALTVDRRSAPGKCPTATVLHLALGVCAAAIVYSSCAPPRLALYALPALAPRCTHTNRPCSQASGG